MIFKRAISLLPALLMAAVITSCSHRNEIPFTVLPLFDLTNSETLGLEYAPGAETITIFSPGDSSNRYNNGVVLFPFGGRLYAQWQSSAKDEDAADTRVFYSSSSDGATWSEPAAMTAIEPGIITTSGGWWSSDDTLVAFINVWQVSDSSRRVERTDYLLSADGIRWSSPRTVTSGDGTAIPGIIEQDIHSLPDGRLITAFHVRPGLQAVPFYTDDSSARGGWRPGEMRYMPVTDDTMSRGIEPSSFIRSDGAVVMVFRDQSGSFKKLASVSLNKGKSWSSPVLVDMPDSRSKQSAGNLPDGTAYIVSNPSGSRERIPLVITLSSNGFLFDRAFLLRSGHDLQPMRYEGRYKRRGYSYPKSVVWNGWLYVSYATNKEDVELTRILLDSLMTGRSLTHR